MKYNELNLKQKASVIKAAVKSGYRKLDDIEEAYNSFANGGEKTSNYKSANSLSTANVENTVYNPIREKLYNNLLPFGYDRPVERVINAVVKNKKETYSPESGVTEDTAEVLDDIWGNYLGIPEDKRHPKNTANKGQHYIDNGKEYYSYNNSQIEDASLDAALGAYFNESHIAPYEGLPIGGKTLVPSNQILGNYWVSRGVDPTYGEYIQYDDTWDINPFKSTSDSYGQEKKGIGFKIGNALFGDKENLSDVGKPVNIRGRYFLDDVYNVPTEAIAPDKGDYYGGVLPELYISGKKHKKANGGGLTSPFSHSPRQEVLYADGGPMEEVGELNLTFNAPILSSSSPKEASTPLVAKPDAVPTKKVISTYVQKPVVAGGMVSQEDADYYNSQAFKKRINVMGDNTLSNYTNKRLQSLPKATVNHDNTVGSFYEPGVGFNISDKYLGMGFQNSIEDTKEHEKAHYIYPGDYANGLKNESHYSSEYLEHLNQVNPNRVKMNRVYGADEVTEDTGAHDSNVIEKIPFIYEARDAMKNLGIWDYRKGEDITPEQFQKFMKLLPKSRLGNYTDEENAIWLLNNTASINTGLEDSKYQFTV